MAKRNKWAVFDFHTEVCHRSEDVFPDLKRKLEKAKNDYDRFCIGANIPKKYRCFTLEQLRPDLLNYSVNENSFEIIEKYLNNLDKAVEKNIGLYISGQNGVGAKTTLACIILRSVIKSQYSAYYVKSYDLVKFYRSGAWQRDKEQEALYEYIFKNADFMVIDEFLDEDDEYTTNIQCSVIKKIFTKRYENNKVTIMTSRFKVDEENNKSLFTDSLRSKIEEHLISVHFVGQDHRKQIGGENLIKQLDS